jgi:hypothetical protein
VPKEAPAVSAAELREPVSLPVPMPRRHRLTVGPSCLIRQGGTQEAADRQRRAASVTVARFARGTPRALVASGPWALIVWIVWRLSGCQRKAGLDQAPRVPGRAHDGLAPVVRQLVANVLYARKPPRSTRCSGNASATGASEPGIWTQAAYCARSSQEEWIEISNASSSFG